MQQMEFVVIRRTDLNEIIRDAALAGAETALRRAPKRCKEQYNILETAQELDVCRHTVKKMINAGEIKLNTAGKIPASEIDRLLVV